jgi:hypothetical protein
LWYRGTVLLYRGTILQGLCKILWWRGTALFYKSTILQELRMILLYRGKALLYKSMILRKLCVILCYKSTALLHRSTHTHTNIHAYIHKRWFKYDRDYLCVNKSQFVPVIFEPHCIYISLLILKSNKIIFYY